MTMQDWGAVGELVGGLAIIVSLVYVGLQIRQSTQASRAGTSQSFSSQYTELNLQIARADFHDIWWRGLGGIQNLQGSETAAFMAYLSAIMLMWESFFDQRKDGTFEPRKFDSWLAHVLDLFGNEGVREYWAIRKHGFTAEFVEFFDEKIAASESKPMYERQSIGDPLLSPEQWYST